MFSCPADALRGRASLQHGPAEAGPYVVLNLLMPSG
jgi:hypothetical protein